jgi:hypothetical protein
MYNPKKKYFFTINNFQNNLILFKKKLNTKHNTIPIQ